MRRDAKKIKIGGMTQLVVDLKPKRCNSDVFINQKMDVTKLMKYVEKKKKDGEEITFFHAILTAIGKVFYNRQKMNWFVANRHIYEHNDVVISFVAKVSFDDKAEELMILVKVEPDDTLETISKKIKDKVDAIRNGKATVDGANNAMNVLGKLPNIVRVPVVGLFKWMDKKGILPASLMKDNLYYSSIIVSNLGALHCGAIYHNLTNFGTASGLLTIGEAKEENGAKLCEFGINLDERTVDGYYLIKSLKMLQYIFDNPELLDEPANTKIEMPELR